MQTPYHLISRFDMVEACVVRCRLNRDGYDWHGNYWGVGLPLWSIILTDCNGDLHTHQHRAINETRLAMHIRSEYPNATMSEALQDRLAALVA